MTPVHETEDELTRMQELLDASHAASNAHLVRHYGSSPSSWAELIGYVRVRPTWMVGYAFKRAELLAARGVSAGGR